MGRDYLQDETWVDPIVGLRLRTPPDRPVHLQVYSEIGDFGAGSDFTWQIFPTVGFKIAPKASLEVGYRWLDLDYSKGEGTEKFPLHEFRARLAELPRDREIHVICRSAQRAYYATRILLQHGFKARSISGGMLSRAMQGLASAAERDLAAV